MTMDKLSEAVERVRALMLWLDAGGSPEAPGGEIGASDLRLILSAVPRAGGEGDFVLVPREPTEEMIAAARGGAVLDASTAILFNRGLLANWKAMLSAAPTQPAVPQEVREKVADVIVRDLERQFRVSGSIDICLDRETGVLDYNGCFRPVELADAILSAIGPLVSREEAAMVAERFGRPVGAGDGDTHYILGSPREIAAAIRSMPAVGGER